MCRSHFLAWLTVLVLFAHAKNTHAQLADVPAAFEAVHTEGRSHMFASGDSQVPEGGHWQGVQMRFDADRICHWMFLTHDSATTGYVYVVKFPASLDEPGKVAHVHEFPSDGGSPPLRHSGGCQLRGNFLAVGVEDNQEKTRSEVQLWDISDPLNFHQLPHLTVRRQGDAKSQTAGAVGLAEVDGHHILVVANWDSRDIDFYQTNDGSLSDPKCCWNHIQRWSVSSADTSEWLPNTEYGAYQSVQLLTDAAGQLYLVGFHTSRDDIDTADLFMVNLEASAEKTLRKIVSRTMMLQDGSRFRYAAGLWIDRGSLRFLASERTLQPTTHLTITP
ncbi:MAG: hypothetical protein KDA86_15440 [Planctomycetaceae bacterium]|nr:hypothetical protein [Planctomycetaceae bacterium]